MWYNDCGDNMKTIIISDIHGHSENFKKVIEFMKVENIDNIIILGDIFNNYYELNVSSKEISQLIWEIYDKVVITRGNCDTNYDQTLLPVGLVNHYETIINGKRCYFHHGHLSVPYSSSIKLFGSGHTHITKLNKIDDVIYLNPGSLGRPRDFKVGTFAVITPNAITIFDVNFNVIDEMVI